jgi:Cdc6-like AAA superfamily ATPase
MEPSESGAQDLQDSQERRFYYPVSNTKQMVFDQLPTLPLHFKLVLYACLSLLSQDKKELKVTKIDVFLEYKQLATELNIEWLSMSRVIDIIKVLELLGFLKCKYVRKDKREIKYVHILDPSEAPRYVTALQDELEKIRKEFEGPKKL